MSSPLKSWRGIGTWVWRLYIWDSIKQESRHASSRKTLIWQCREQVIFVVEAVLQSWINAYGSKMFGLRMSSRSGKSLPIENYSSNVLLAHVSPHYTIKTYIGVSFVFGMVSQERCHDSNFECFEFYTTRRTIAWHGAVPICYGILSHESAQCWLGNFGDTRFMNRCGIIWRRRFCLVHQLTAGKIWSPWHAIFCCLRSWCQCLVEHFSWGFRNSRNTLWRYIGSQLTDWVWLTSAVDWQAVCRSCKISKSYYSSRRRSNKCRAGADDRDLVTKIFGGLFGQKALEDRKPFGMQRMSDEDMYELYPATTTKFAAPVDSDDSNMKLFRPLLAQTRLEKTSLRWVYRLQS